MNREQAINYLICRGFTNEQVGDVVRALTYDPTTKNNLGVDLISRADVNRIICEYRDDATETGSERDLERAYGANAVGELISELPSVTPQLSSELEKNSKKLEKGTTKNDLSVDIKQLKTMIRGLTKWYVKRDNTEVGEPNTAVGLLYDDVMFGIDRLPSVTPQEPTIKALGEELRKARKGIADEKVLIGYNLAVAICNKHLGGK